VVTVAAVGVAFLPQKAAVVVALPLLMVLRGLQVFGFVVIILAVCRVLARLR
jgi:hypothetical protein